MKMSYICLLLFPLLLFAVSCDDNAEWKKVSAELDKCNVVWTTPSVGQRGSMPDGNGETALNVWTEPDGNLYFLIARTDAWGDNSRPLKLGRVKLHFEPNIFTENKKFRQELVLRDGVVRITSGNNGEERAEIKVWVDANRDVIHVDGRSSFPLSVAASVELWRTTRRRIKREESMSVREVWNDKDPDVVVEPDTIFPAENNMLIWCHRNVKSPFSDSFKAQHLSDIEKKYHDPILNRTFGCIMSGDGFKTVSGTKITTSGPVKEFSVKVVAYTAQTETAAEWKDEIKAYRDKALTVSESEAWSRHCAWWRDFWMRSWIFSDGSSDSEFLAKMYNLQRWITACQGRGRYPIKFNGGLFCVGNNTPWKKYTPQTWDPDYRRWGGGYWFQNTRFPYWSMLASGDYDMMTPLYSMYLKMLPLLEERTQKYFGHGGVYFGETIYFWGLYPNKEFGWDNPGKYTVNHYIRYYFQSGIELTAMMLDTYLQNRDEQFLKTTLFPIADKVLEFYAKHYPYSKEGILEITPAQSLETYRRGVVNPLPEIIGLHVVLKRLLALPETLTNPEQRKAWRKLQSSLPPVPVRTEGGQTFFAPAEKYREKRGNFENPSLYPVFPYRYSAVGQSALRTGLNTWPRRVAKQVGCWRQDFVESAMLGLTDEAAENALKMAKLKDPLSRFPAFWQKGFDWMPDQDHGGNFTIGLQRMLLQWDDAGKIYILPAWPEKWPVAFKLHARDGILVEVIYSNGKLNVTTTPEINASRLVLPFSGAIKIPEERIKRDK